MANETSIFKSKNWVEVIDDSGRVQNIKSQIKFKTSMLKECLCDYKYAQITVNEAITATVDGTGDCLQNKQTK